MDQKRTVSVSSGGGIGLGTIAAIVIIVLEALGKIHIGWFWAISSIIWAPIATFIAFLVFFLVILFFVAVIGVIFNR